ncbi:MAG TPA: hypothetical protein VF611_13675 [Pyrinomonadaceae bacterium]|jgi:hypothetical protein
MKHRSVIAFVIVAAALFAAPQVSHDLQSFMSALGSCLRGELMHVFLSLPAGEGTAEGTPSAVAPRPAETLLASCTKAKPAAKPRKGEPSAPTRAGVGAAERARRSEGEVAMIIPPDSGIDPRELARASESAARVGAAHGRELAEKVRMTYVAARVNVKGSEWRMAEEALRGLEGRMPGAYEFRLERDGSKTRVLKVRRACCPPPAPPAPRPAGVDAATAPPPMPSVGVVSAFVGE